MKRTEMKRKTPLPKSYSKPRGKAMERKPKKGEGRKRKASTDARWRSSVYLEWVRAQPCCVCGTTWGVIAHHLISMWQVSGMGLKAADSFAMPVCDGPGDTCHRKIHASKTLQALQPQWIEQTIREAIANGAYGETRDELMNALAFIHDKEAT